jgi:hypothetical protein
MYPDLAVLTLWELQAPLHDNSGYFIRTLNGMYLVIFAFEFCCKPIPYMVSDCAGETKSRASMNCNAH